MSATEPPTDFAQLACDHGLNPDADAVEVVIEALGEYASGDGNAVVVVLWFEENLAESFRDVEREDTTRATGYVVSRTDDGHRIETTTRSEASGEVNRSANLDTGHSPTGPLEDHASRMFRQLAKDARKAPPVLADLGAVAECVNSDHGSAVGRLQELISTTADE